MGLTSSKDLNAAKNSGFSQYDAKNYGKMNEFIEGFFLNPSLNICELTNISLSDLYVAHENAKQFCAGKFIFGVRPCENPIQENPRVTIYISKSDSFPDWVRLDTFSLKIVWDRERYRGDFFWLVQDQLKSFMVCDLLQSIEFQHVKVGGEYKKMQTTISTVAKEWKDISIEETSDSEGGEFIWVKFTKKSKTETEGGEKSNTNSSASSQ